MTLHRTKIDLLNLERYPDTLEGVLAENPNCRDPQKVLDWNIRSNEQADRIEFLMLDIVTRPDFKPIEYADIMHWKDRAAYLRRKGDVKAARELEQAEAKALQDAHDADDDEEFMLGFRDFLANEFE